MIGELFRRARHGRSHRALAAILAVVLAANAVVLLGGFAGGDSGLADAALTLAATGDATETELDPLAGVVVEVPTRAVAPSSVQLPVPEAPPANAYAPTPEVRHGQLEIPAIGLSQPFFEGVTLTAINRGPSHWPGSAMPGEIGNVVIAGHRTTYTKPFWALNELNPGDELIFTLGNERIVYELDRVDIVVPTDIHIIEQTPEPTATLFACHPRGSARQRIVGHFRLKGDTVPIEFFDTLGGGQPSGY